MNKQFILFLFLILSTFSFGQIIKYDTLRETQYAALPYYSYGKGLGLTSPDSIFQLNIRFRMQNRATFYEDEFGDESIDAQIRRLRLRFDGYVGNPKFMYSIQLSFAPEDVGELEDGGNINIIRDAVVVYKPNEHWDFSFGQTKLPGNRQRLNSSGGLQLTDRTINNAKFNIDRDFGLQIHNTNEFEDKLSYNFRGSISMGEGRNWTDNNDTGLALTGKAELYPFGSFKKTGAYFEGDLMRETKPKLMLSAAYSQNNQAKRERGQLGKELFASRTMRSVFGDLIFKYDGWAFMSAFMTRMADDPVTVNPEDANDIRYVFVGKGVDFQGSYLFKNNFEVIGRYSNQWVDDEIRNFEPNTQQFSLGLTKYIWEHAFKLQAEATYETHDYFLDENTNNWYVRFQVEIGI
ncbi:porin [Moheibacter lacus]|uniref:Porin n=1 Tax=Moheibacter lacus TaxID=2745851 RepID=A0A838ZUJ7_9FLAO|nr:porin [Moheibacter lacus]MBA5630589.1 porin [Moheibacter lacus]